MKLGTLIINTFGCDFGCSRLSEVSTNLFDRKGRKIDEESNLNFSTPKELNSRDEKRLITLLQRINNDPTIYEVEVKFLDNGIVIHHCSPQLFLFK